MSETEDSLSEPPAKPVGSGVLDFDDLLKI